MMTDGRNQSVWLNNVSLTTVHPSIIVQHISEGELEYNQILMTRPQFGNLIARNSPSEREITIEFAIRERLNYATRVAAIQAVYKWAADGGVLRLSSHPGQEIYVTCKKLPALGRLREWNEDLQIVFSANEFPFWVDQEPITVTYEEELAISGELYPVGTCTGFLEADITPTRAINHFSLGNNDFVNFFEVEAPTAVDLAAAGETIRVYYDNHHYLHIANNTEELLKYRTGADDIITYPGVYNNVMFSAGIACKVVFKARGVYL